MQAITPSDNAPVCNKHSGYLRLSFITACVATYLIYYTGYISSIFACYNWNTINEIISLLHGNLPQCPES